MDFESDETNKKKNCERFSALKPKYCNIQMEHGSDVKEQQGAEPLPSIIVLQAEQIAPSGKSLACKSPLWSAIKYKAVIIMQLFLTLQNKIPYKSSLFLMTFLQETDPSHEIE